MTRLLAILSLLSCLLFNSAKAATYYIDYVAGSDANAGTSTGAPWKRHPYMAGFTGTYVHAAGDAFIFKGGSEWPSACFPLLPTAGGTAANKDAYGTNGSWGTGRAIFDGGGASFGALSGLFVIDASYNAQGISITGFEMRSINCTISDGVGLILCHNTRDVDVTNCWLHGWTMSVGTDGQHGGLIDQVDSGKGATNLVFADGRISNAENYTARNGCCVVLWGTLTNSLLDDNSSCVLLAQDMNFCVVSNIDVPGGTDADTAYHKNGFYMDNPNGFTGPGPGTNLYCRNSVFYNVYSTPIYPNVDIADCYIYNCLSYGGAGSDLQILLDPFNASGGHAQHSCYIYNNTVVIYGSDATGIYTVPRLAYTAPNYVGQIVSNLWITNNLFIGTGSTVPMSYPTGYTNALNGAFVGVVDQFCGHNVAMTPTAAASAGYTLANLYMPTQTGSPTVGVGANLSALALFTGSLNNVARGSTWDIGAYQFAGVTYPRIIGKPGSPVKIIGKPGSPIRIIGKP